MQGQVLGEAEEQWDALLLGLSLHGQEAAFVEQDGVAQPQRLGDLPEVEVDAVVAVVDEALHDGTPLVVESQVYDVGDVDAVDEVHGMRSHHDADTGQGALLADDVHDRALVAVVEVGVGLVVDDDRLDRFLGVQVVRGGQFGRFQEIAGPLPDGECDAAGALLAGAGQVDGLTVGPGDFQRRPLEAGLEGDFGLDLNTDELPAVPADVLAQRVGFLLQALSDLRFDLAHLSLECLVLEVSFVAAVQRGAHGIVGALVLAAEGEKARQAGFELFGQRLPLFDLGYGAGVSRDSSEQVFLEGSGRSQPELRDEVGERLLEKPVKSVQAAVGRLLTVVLPAG
ncbi:hypothetical protein [Streptomyces mutomycini]|uniref:Uncharacterized protein n=1 Tax=Streptomyces mutomycini TaxID=284036 RepID=A0ABW0BCK4_9ACTN